MATIGIDLAKSVFAVHSVDTTLIELSIERAELLQIMTSLPTGLTSMN